MTRDEVQPSGADRWDLLAEQGHDIAFIVQMDDTQELVGYDCIGCGRCGDVALNLELYEPCKGDQAVRKRGKGKGEFFVDHIIRERRGPHKDNE